MAADGFRSEPSPIGELIGSPSRQVISRIDRMSREPARRAVSQIDLPSEIEIAVHELVSIPFPMSIRGLNTMLRRDLLLLSLLVCLCPNLLAQQSSSEAIELIGRVSDKYSQAKSVHLEATYTTSTHSNLFDYSTTSPSHRMDCGRQTLPI